MTSWLLHTAASGTSVCAGAAHIQLIFSPSPSKLLVPSEGTVILCTVKANSSIVPVILNVVTGWRKMVSFVHRPLYPRKKTPVPFEKVCRGAIPELVLMFCREGKSHASPSSHNQDCLAHSPVTALVLTSSAVIQCTKCDTSQTSEFYNKWH